MKITASLSLLFSAVLAAQAQGTFVYDQQSATDGMATFLSSINRGQPIGQAFTPSLGSVGFVQIQLVNVQNLTNATIAVNLWGDSLGGTLLGSSDPLSLPAGYGPDTANLLFASPVAVNPGSTYYLQPVIQAGGNNSWFVLTDFYNYSGGALFIQGQPRTDGLTAWFREGIIVPEPTVMSLLLLGLGGWFCARQIKLK